MKTIAHLLLACKLLILEGDTRNYTRLGLALQLPVLLLRRGVVSAGNSRLRAHSVAAEY